MLPPLLPFFMAAIFALLVFALWVHAFSLSFVKAGLVAFIAGVFMFWCLTA